MLRVYFTRCFIDTKLEYQTPRSSIGSSETKLLIVPGESRRAVFIAQLLASANSCRRKVFFSPAAQLHLSSNPFFLLFVSSLFTHCSPFRLLSYNFTSMVLRLIQPRTMRQSGEQLFSVNSAVILALCISPLILRSATPSCCSPRFDTIWGGKSHSRSSPAV